MRKKILTKEDIEIYGDECLYCHEKLEEGDTVIFESGTGEIFCSEDCDYWWGWALTH